MKEIFFWRNRPFAHVWLRFKSMTFYMCLRELLLFKTGKRVPFFMQSSIKMTYFIHNLFKILRGCHGRDCMVVGFRTTCATSAYHHKSCEFKPSSWRGVIDTTLCDKVCQWLATGRWFSQCTPVSSTNMNKTNNCLSLRIIGHKTDHDIYAL